jgi:hypothetical protein
MRVGFAVVVLSGIALCVPGGAQGLPAQFGRLSPSWEARLEAGDGQRVRQEAEALLGRPDVAIRESSHTDLHAKVGVLGMAARGAVLEGDWQGAVSLLAQAAATAKSNYAAASVALQGLRGQHEAKIAEWKDLMGPREEQLRWLKEQPGLRSEQIRQYSEVETFLTEHQNAISNSERSIRDIDDILSRLRAEEDTCSRSLDEWDGFLARESAEMQELGSGQRYVTEKLAQVMGNDKMSRFERISFARRLQRLDPANAAVKEFLNSLVGAKKAEPAATQAKAPAKTQAKAPAKVQAKAPAKKSPAPAKPAAKVQTKTQAKAPAEKAPAPAKPAAADGEGQTGADKEASGNASNADKADSGSTAAKADQAKPEPAKADAAKPEPAKSEPPKPEPAKDDQAKTGAAKTDAAKPDPPKPEQAKPEQAKADQAKADAAKPEPGKIRSMD